jgi:hypothetical protein
MDEKQAHSSISDHGIHTHAPPPEIALRHDVIAPEAIGGIYKEMPSGYYRGVGFIGTVIVSTYIVLVELTLPWLIIVIRQHVWRSSAAILAGYCLQTPSY